MMFPMPIEMFFTGVCYEIFKGHSIAGRSHAAY